MSPILDDLARVHEEWHAAYRRFAEQPHSGLRRRLLQLSAQALGHPHWRTRTGAWAALQGARHGQVAS
ncbi:hypothetical protein ACWEL8_09340 [Streptomyces sp. NPDC004690]